MGNNRELNKNFVNFCWDQIVSAGVSKDLSRRVNGDLPEEYRANYLLERRSTLDLDLWRNIYNYVNEWILGNVQLEHRAMLGPVVDVSFDRRFGWVASGNGGGKAYLGKINIAATGNLDLKIGHRTYLSGDWLLDGRGEVAIGSFTAIGQDLAIKLLGPHPINYASLYNFDGSIRMEQEGKRIPLELDANILFMDGGRVRIGNDVWIGRNVEISAAVDIKDGCVIGERSLVLKGIVTEPYGIYAGIPAKQIGSRFSDNVISELLELRWWDWPEEKIGENSTLFSTDLTTYKSSLADLIV